MENVTKKVTAVDEFNIILAEDKMLKEMSKEHSAYQDSFHNWLCTQMDDAELVSGILKDDRTIAGAEEFVLDKAVKQATRMNSGGPLVEGAMIDSITVFGWVRNYFTMEKLPEKEKPKVRINPTSEEYLAKERERKIKDLEENPKYKDYLAGLKKTASDETYQETIDELLQGDKPKAKTKSKQAKEKEFEEISLFDTSEL
ncbi:Cas9 inhibitor AcrIIA9 family protein [Streptococcus hyointestinalis]|uniref:Phage protein n=1 Tax=Streptococcus hyointestinalis TaxID=1337 RepID=A0A380JZL0_9STRE|nr:Cas9 inhibitor AcrIIA9 family protein [Streptococcus hyointestinalis]SUN58167.1 phage protein [Streptococcus hyointestinalis]